MRNIIFENGFQPRNDIQNLFRWVNFVLKTIDKSGVIQSTLLGARFYYLPYFDLTAQLKIIETWWLESKLESNINLQSLKEVICSPDAKHGALVPGQNLPINDSIFEMISLNQFKMLYTGIIVETINEYNDINEITKVLTCVRTPTCINQLAHLFASVLSGYPILVIGPPGIGKTAMINQVCKIIGRKPERINCSANTTTEQLFGSLIPKLENGKRVFKWQDGKIVQAIRNEKWILLDEINLAPPGVLDSLVELINKCGADRIFQVSSTGEKFNVKYLRIFATMNPVSVGGGRSKLPRSVQNLFTQVNLDVCRDEELYSIILNLFSDLTNTEGCLTFDDLKNLFDFYIDLKSRLSAKEIGRIGGPYELNLRDFVKFHDVLKENFKDQKYHYNFFSTGLEDDEQKFDVLVLRRFAELVFAKQYPCLDDQKRVMSLIDKYFPISNPNENFNYSNYIDTTDEDTTRINFFMIFSLV